MRDRARCCGGIGGLCERTSFVVQAENLTGSTHLEVFGVRGSDPGTSCSIQMSRRNLSSAALGGLVIPR